MIFDDDCLILVAEFLRNVNRTHREQCKVNLSATPYPGNMHSPAHSPEGRKRLLGDPGWGIGDLIRFFLG